MPLTTRLRWAALTLFPLLALTDATDARSGCIIGGACGDPPPHKGGGSSGGSSGGGGTSSPPAQDPEVAVCMGQNPPPASCQPILANEILRQRTYNLTPTRSMFHPDTVNAYPDNMATTLPSDLLSHVGAATNATALNNQLSTNTELTYHSILVGDWAAAKGGSLLPNYSELNWSPHPFHSDPNTVSSCQEWVYRKWNQALPSQPAPWVSGVQDGVASCGADNACRLDIAFYNPSSPFYSGSSSVYVPTTQARTNAQVGIAYRSNVAVQKNPFYQVDGRLFEDQAAAIQQNVVTTSWDCNQGLQGPFSPDPSDVVDFEPTKYTGANAAQKTSTLMSLMFAPPVYLIGSASAPAGSPILASYPAESQMITDLWGKRVLPGAPLGQAAAYDQDDPFETALRDRVAHLREMLALYQTLTHFTCADLPPTSSGSGSGGGGGGGGGGGSSGASSGGHNHAVEAPISVGGSPPPPTGLAAKVAAAAEVQDEIVSFMLDEWDRGDAGCYGSNQTACDVDPVEVTSRVLSSFDAPQEADFQSCIEWTGNNFGTTTVDGVDALILQRFQAAEARLLNAPGVDPATDPTPPPGSQGSGIQRDAVGQVITGSRYMGDPNLAGGGYSYGAYWKATPKDFAGPTSNGAPTACELDGEVHGELHGRIDLLKASLDPICSPVDQLIDSLAAQGKSFGDPAVAQAFSTLGNAVLFGFPNVFSLCDMRYRLRHVADAYLTATAVPGQVGYQGDVFFGGTQMWSVQDSGATPNITASWPADPQTIQGPEMTVYVVVVPVTFDLSAEIQYGATGIAQAGSIQNCGNPSLQASVQFEPWATVDGIGSIGVGFSFAQAGVRGKIRILDARLPMNAFVEIAPDQSGNLALQAGAHANLNLGMMDGSLSAFAELNLGLVDEEAETQLASWSGLHTTIPILNWDLQPIQLPVFDQNTWDQFEATAQGQ
jgi:hypothetical protein